MTNKKPALQSATSTASMLGRDEETVYRYVRKGLLKNHGGNRITRGGHKQVLIDRNEVEKLVASGRIRKSHRRRLEDEAFEIFTSDEMAREKARASRKYVPEPKKPVAQTPGLTRDVSELLTTLVIKMLESGIHEITVTQDAKVSVKRLVVEKLEL